MAYHFGEPIARQRILQERDLSRVAAACIGLRGFCSVAEKHTGEPTSPPRLMKARTPPLWEMQGQGAALSEDEPQSQPMPECGSTSALPGRCQCAKVQTEARRAVIANHKGRNPQERASLKIACCPSG
mgnify:CR=1 FL=1